MSLNFLKKECQKKIEQRKQFGLCDEGLGTMAYAKFENADTWIATVNNPEEIDLVFTAIDKCVLQDDDEAFSGIGRCDCMLHSGEHLCLVELKEKKPPWQTLAIKQLKSTVELLKTYHGDWVIGHKTRAAYACNRKRPNPPIDEDFKLKQYQFKDETGFLLKLEAEITIE